MAIRYSGDVEVRLRQLSRAGEVGFQFHLCSPGFRTDGFLPARYVRISPQGRKPSPELYDRAAEIILHVVQAREGLLPVETNKGALVLRRVFQSACPKRILKA